MVTLPREFIAIRKYPGYFWNSIDKRLYSLKKFGVLNPLKRQKHWKLKINGYFISHQGKQLFLFEKELINLTHFNYEIPANCSYKFYSVEEK